MYNVSLAVCPQASRERDSRVNEYFRGDGRKLITRNGDNMITYSEEISGKYQNKIRRGCIIYKGR